MKTPSARVLKVEATGDFFRQDIRPLIRLRGQWLARLGFNPEGHVIVEPIKPGELRLVYRGKIRWRKRTPKFTPRAG